MRTYKYDENSEILKPRTFDVAPVSSVNGSEIIIEIICAIPTNTGIIKNNEITPILHFDCEVNDVKLSPLFNEEK